MSNNDKKNISDTVRLQLKPKTASSSAFNADKNIVNTAKKNIKYTVLGAALEIMMILLYFLISTIKTLMTI